MVFVSLVYHIQAHYIKLNELSPGGKDRVPDGVVSGNAPGARKFNFFFCLYGLCESSLSSASTL